MGRSIFLLIPLALLSGPVCGVDIGGRLTSSLYTYESRQSDTTSTFWVRASQGLRLELSDLGIKGVSFHTYLRGTTDLSKPTPADPGLRVFHAHLAWKRERYRFQLGRQRIQAGVGSGAIDGVRGDLEWGKIALTLFAGPLAPLTGEAEVGSWSAGHLWGARLSTSRFFSTDLALSFADRSRAPKVYAAPSQYLGFTGQPATQLQRLVGLDLGRRFRGGHTLYARLDYDGEAGIIRRAEASGRCVFSPRFAIQAEWFRRVPSILSGSLFSVFPSAAYQEWGTRFYLLLRPELQLTAHLAALFLDGDSAQRLGLTAAIGQCYTLGYYRSMGYAHPGDGLTGSVCHPVGRKLQFTGEFNLTSYERSEEAGEREELATGALGLTYRPNPKIAIDLELQGLRNPLYASDLRLFLRGSWRFFKRGER